jgi:hypothetical protein
MEPKSKMMKVLCPVTNERTSRTFWMRVGNAYENRDGSTNVYLDAYPANGRLQIRELDERDWGKGRNRDSESESSGAAELSSDQDELPF